jgi:putative phosphoribosyl transferase
MKSAFCFSILQLNKAFYEILIFPVKIIIPASTLLYFLIKVCCLTRVTAMFQDREDAALQLAERLKSLDLHDPVVLAIPRGGVVTGAVLARVLGAELDVVLARKLRAPGQAELAIGAISEDGRVYLNRSTRSYLDRLKDYLEREQDFQMDVISRRKKLYRGIRPQAPVKDRSVIVTDDGIATGSTMIAALHSVKMQNPRALIVAVPVASPDRLKEVRRFCDKVVCLLSPKDFYAIGQFYEDFRQVEDEEVVALLGSAERSLGPHPEN